MHDNVDNIAIYGSYFRLLPPELMSIQCINPYTAHDSQSRQTMMASHISQALQMQCAMPRFDPTGIERKYGEYTFKMEMPVDAYIRECVHKYTPKAMDRGNHVNPLTTVIYEHPIGHGVRQFGILNIEAHHCMHQHYGFRYQLTAEGKELRPDTSVKAGTVFAKSPTINDEGDWMYGVEANVATMTLPGVIEDGVIARRGMLEKMKVKAYGTRTVSWGKTMVPLNLYGDSENYKPFPDLGDPIRPDGLLFSLREFNPETAPIGMHHIALRLHDTFDRGTYAEPDAKVVNIEVFRGRKTNDFVTLSQMNAQCEEYYDRTYTYYKRILDVYEQVRRETNKQMRLTPEFTNLVAMAQEIVDQYEGRTNTMYLMNDAPLDEWMVRITYEYTVTPTVGFKLTGCHGDKVVIVAVWDDDRMPKDQWGNVADFIQDPDGTNRRMNLGRVYQQYFKAAMREVGLNVVERWKNKSAENTRAVYEYLVRFYEILSPKFAKLVRDRYDADPMSHLIKVERFVLKYKSVKVWMPVDNPVSYYDVYLQLEKEYPVPIGPVTFKGVRGNLVTTKSDVLIAPMYLMLLEKTGNSWSAVSSARLQHFGNPAKVSAIDKYITPGKQSPCRIFGEGEVRLIDTMCGTGEIVAEIFDQNTNPATHSHICNNLMSTPTPTRVAQILDRRRVLRTGGRVNEYVAHNLECAGLRHVYGNSANANQYERPAPYQY